MRRVLLCAALSACGEPPAVEEIAPLAEGSLEAFGVLGFLNGPDATYDVLDVDVGLEARAARNIVSHVRGADETLGGGDDNLLDSIAELDGIPYVGAVALGKLSAYVASIGAMPALVVEAVAFTTEQAAATVALANGATRERLDDEVGLDSRAAGAIVAARPIADLAALAAVSWVGKQALTRLRDFAPPAAPETPDTEWIAAAIAEADRLVTDYAPLDPYRVDVATTPAAAQARAAASAAVLELPTAYRVPVRERLLFLILATDGSGEGNVVVVDLIDDRGAWFAHGIAHTLWDGGGGLNWSLDDEDPTLCSCDRRDPSTGKATCTWLDGEVSVSNSIACAACAGGTWDGVSFTDGEACHAVDFLNYARFSQMRALSAGARHVAYDCRPGDAAPVCDPAAYRASAWTTLGEWAASPEVGATALGVLKTSAAAWTDDLHWDTIANTWAHRSELDGVTLGFEKIWVPRKVSPGCYELRDFAAGEYYLRACVAPGAVTCGEECWDGMVGRFVWLRATLHRTSTGAWQLALPDTACRDANPAL
jgi:hypothetical protein